MRLFPKFLLAFVAVVLLAVLTVALVARTAAQREVNTYMVAGGMTTESNLARELAGYYAGRGSWAGVEELLGPGHGMGGMGGHMMGQRIILADAGGRVIVDTGGELLGQPLPDAVLAAGIPIDVDGRPAGTLIAAGGPMGGGPPWELDGAPLESQLLGRVSRSIWLAALVGAAGALVVGSVLAYGLVRPIRALTSATTAIARGQLSQRVAVRSSDEVGDLGTAFNSMAASLERGERLRREMTADIAHELRNPIAVLQGNLEAVIDGVLPPTPDNLQPLLTEVQLLARLVDDLRTLALADAGQLSLERAPTDPGALAQAAVAQFQPQAEARQVALAAEVAPGLPPVAVDAQRITQVLGNLLSNAIRFTPPGGRVTCRVELSDGSRALEAGGPAASRAPSLATVPAAGGPARTSNEPPPAVVYTISDTGPGIAPEALPHVFERFYRVDSARARADGGTGLGLTIARKIVEAHGGHIAAASQPGQGAEFSFSLPL